MDGKLLRIYLGIKGGGIFAELGLWGQKQSLIEKRAQSTAWQKFEQGGNPRE